MARCGPGPGRRRAGTLPPSQVAGADQGPLFAERIQPAVFFDSSAAKRYSDAEYRADGEKAK